MVNPGTEAAEVTISARDDAGVCAPGGLVTLTIPAGASQTLAAQALEAGEQGFTGSFGDGTGKWRLFVTSNVPIEAMSLLSTATGHLANLSTVPFDASADNCRETTDPTDPTTPVSPPESRLRCYGDLTSTGRLHGNTPNPPGHSLGIGERVTVYSTRPSYFGGNVIWDYHYSNIVRDLEWLGVDGPLSVCIGPYFVDDPIDPTTPVSSLESRLRCYGDLTLTGGLHGNTPLPPGHTIGIGERVVVYGARQGDFGGNAVWEYRYSNIAPELGLLGVDGPLGVCVGPYFVDE